MTPLGLSGLAQVMDILKKEEMDVREETGPGAGMGGSRGKGRNDGMKFYYY